MFVLRSTLLLVIVAAFAPAVEAQLFRFRRPVQQPQQAPANYDAAAYRYTQARTPVTNVPSQRYVQRQQQQQAPQCRQRVVYVPVQVQQAQQGQTIQQRLAQQQLAQQQQQQQLPQQQVGQTTPQTYRQQVAVQTSQQVVMLNVRDPYTGRTVQRPYIIRRTTRQAVPQQIQPRVAAVAGQQPLLNSTVNPTTSPQTVLSTMPPNGVVTPTIDPSSGPSEKIAATSYESPVMESSETNYSVLDNGEDEIKTEVTPDTATAAADALPQLDLEESHQATETVKPVLEPAPALEPAPSSETPVLDPPEADEPGGLEFDTDGSFDLDLPPLGNCVPISYRYWYLV